MKIAAKNTKFAAGANRGGNKKEKDTITSLLYPFLIHAFFSFLALRHNYV
jgi:hypothetical protein